MQKTSIFSKAKNLLDKLYNTNLYTNNKKSFCFFVMYTLTVWLIIYGLKKKKM